MPSILMKSTTALLTCGSYDKKQQGGTVHVYTLQYYNNECKMKEN